MGKFLGLILLTGIVSKPTLASYWSTSVLLITPIFPLVMPRNRFQALLRFWHCNDNSKVQARNNHNRDRLYVTVRDRNLVSLKTITFQGPVLRVGTKLRVVRPASLGGWVRISFVRDEWEENSPCCSSSRVDADLLSWFVVFVGPDGSSTVFQVIWTVMLTASRGDVKQRLYLDYSGERLDVLKAHQLC